MFPETEATNINDLPEDILRHIISFIPSIDAVKTSAVVRSWRNLWHSVLTLNFDVKRFHLKNRNKSTGEVCQLFNDFICNTLLRRSQQNPSLHCFKLLFCYNKSYFGSWLRSVIAAKVVELDLDFNQYGSLPEMFYLDPTLFSDIMKSSVEVLKLRYIYLRFPDLEALMILPLRLESIREVSLSYFRSTDKEIADFIASCVHLQSLYLVRGSGLKNLKIVSQQLKHLKLHWFNVHRNPGPWSVDMCSEFSVEICAPSLTSVDFSCVYGTEFVLKTSSSLVEAKVQCFPCDRLRNWTNILSCLSTVELLTIGDTWPNYHLPRLEVFSETLVFHNVKRLELWTEFSTNNILSLKYLLKRCPYLVIMVLVNRYAINYDSDYYGRGMPDIVFQVPHLRLVEMKGFASSKIEMHVLSLLKKHGVVLEKVVVYPKKVYGKSQLPFVV